MTCQHECVFRCENDGNTAMQGRVLGRKGSLMTLITVIMSWLLMFLMQKAAMSVGSVKVVVLVVMVSFAALCN